MIFTGSIDAHAHLWAPARQDDILILEQKPDLAPHGTAECLKTHVAQFGLAGCIVVQSAPSLSHSDWLRDAARRIDNVLGVVGWLDPLAECANQHADTLLADPLVCGIRLMLNRMADPDALLQPPALKLLERLGDSGLAIECLAPPRHLPLVARIARALPKTQVVVDHCGLPPLPGAEYAAWQRAFASLAPCPNVSTKLSGLIEPFGPDVQIADVADSAALAIDLFGDGRLMLASNFPVSRLGGGEDRWQDLAQEIVHRAGLDARDRQALARDTAARVYSIAAEVPRQGSGPCPPLGACAHHIPG